MSSVIGLREKSQKYKLFSNSSYFYKKLINGCFLRIHKETFNFYLTTLYKLIRLIHYEEKSIYLRIGIVS